MTQEEKTALAKRNEDIPTETIKKDILDTEKEIEQMKREEQGYRLIGDRMANFRADARQQGIRERQDFIDSLRTILEIRGEL